MAELVAAEEVGPGVRRKPLAIASWTRAHRLARLHGLRYEMHNAITIIAEGCRPERTSEASALSVQRRQRVANALNGLALRTGQG